MGQVARRDAIRPIAGVLSRHAVSAVDRRAPIDANALAACLFVRSWLRYAREMPETFASLEALTRLPVGDCDDMAIALSALCWRLGYLWHQQRFLIGWEGERPVHVWLEVRGARGRWIPLDASTHRIEPGTDPSTIGNFSRVTAYPLELLK